jgi:exonuclease SbcC
MITKVKLKNFRSHLDSEFDFSSGTNVLMGILGSGKSSVMNALCFGLFGTFPDLQGKKIKIDDLIMNKPSVKDQAEVEVEFNVDNKTYSVMRTVERGKGTTYSEIREGDKLLDAPNAQRVTELVERLLKVNYELFSKAIYSEQNALDYFLTLPRGERMKRIDNLLTIDKFEKARSSTVSLKNKLIERKLGKQSIIEQTDIEKLKKTVEELFKSLNELRKDKLEVSTEIETLEKQKGDMEAEVKKLEQLNKNLNYFKEQEKSVESAIEENRKFISEIENLLKGRTKQDIEKNLNEFSQKIKESEKTLEEKRREQEKLTELISETRTKIDFLEKEKMGRLESDISKKLSIKEMINEIKKKYGQEPLEKMKKQKEELDNLIKKITSLSTRLSETKDVLDQIYQLKDHCPICYSKLTDEKKKKLIKNQKEKIEKIEKEIKTIEKEKDVKEESFKSIEDVADKFKHFLVEVESLDEMQSQLKDLKKVYSKSIKTLASYQKNMNTLRIDISNLQKEIDSTTKEEQKLSLLYSRIPEIENKKTRLNYFNSRLQDVQMKLTEINKHLEGQDIEKLRKEFTETVRKKSELEERLKNLNQMFNEKESRKNEEEEKTKIIETQKSEVVKLEKIIKDLKIFEKALEETQVQLRTEFIEAVNFTMSQIWSNLYPYEDFTNIGLNIEGGDYVLQLKDRMGRWINADGVASGGERSIAALALRIAFSLVLAPQLKWLVLDEPTHNLDARAIEDLTETLKTRIGNFIDQVFLITHEERLEEAVTGHLYRLEREKEKDGVTKILFPS